MRLPISLSRIGSFDDVTPNQIVEKRSIQQTQEQQEKANSNIFATHTQHTPAFNTVHIIAAVIGIVGIIIVAITIFILCKKKRSRKKKQQQVKNTNEMEQQQQVTSIGTRATDQFENDFENHIEPPKPAVYIPKENVLTEEQEQQGQKVINSPMMQQYQLQLKLLKEKNTFLDVPKSQQTRQYSHATRASTSSSTYSATSLSPQPQPQPQPQPPPYHP